jgi:hypothetical protein
MENQSENGKYVPKEQKKAKCALGVNICIPLKGDTYV